MDYPPSLEINVEDLPSSRAERAEAVGMRVLEELLEGSSERQDLPGDASGRHDFDVTLPDGTVVAVEVTACIDEEAAGFEAALKQHAVHFDVDGVERSWEIRLAEATRVNGLIERITSRLVELERWGIDGLARPGPFDTSPMVRYGPAAGASGHDRVAVEQVLDMGVDTAWAFDRADGRQCVEFIRRSGGGSGNTEYLVTAEVERAAAIKDSVLSRPSSQARDSRHLFVWIDPDFCGAVEFGLWSGHPAAAPRPSLPPSIDEVWVAMWSLTPGEGIGYVVVWHGTSENGWRYPSSLDPQTE